MQAPRDTATTADLVAFTRYTIRRLKAQKLDAQASDLSGAASRLLGAARAVEDARFGSVDAIGDRDAADDAVDQAIQLFRGRLASQSLDAVRKAPYTLIFPEGIAFYTAAPLDEIGARLKLFVERVTANANDADALQAKAAASAGVTDIANAQAAVRDADLKVQDLRVARDSLEAGLRRSLERVYGGLVAEFGRARAEAFFQRQRGRKTAETPADDAES